MKIPGQKTMKQRFGEGEVLFGTFYKFNCEPIVEMLGMAGMDFIIIDAEHAAYSYWDMENMCRAANGVGMNAVIRVPNSSAEYILHAGDMGAQGIQVPNSKTLEEARAAAESMRYAPFGTRGLGLTTRGSGYCLGGSYTDSDSYVHYVNNDLLSVIMVENMAMAEQIEALCDIPQADVFFVGTGLESRSLSKISSDLSSAAVRRRGLSRLISAKTLVRTSPGRHTLIRPAMLGNWSFRSTMTTVSSRSSAWTRRW